MLISVAVAVQVSSAKISSFFLYVFFSHTFCVDICSYHSFVCLFP